MGFLSVLPLIFISFFNNPGSDDFDLSYESQIEPFWSLQIRRYFEWSGRYFSNGLLSVDPLTYNDYFSFKIVPIFLLLLLVYSIYIFISCLQLNITKLKKQDGKDIIVYGGADFVASLIQYKLIDEFHFLVNPTLLGNGKTIFKNITHSDLQLKKAIGFECGISVLNYELKQN